MLAGKEPDDRLKISLRSPLMLARVALIDQELTYDLPPELTASTGLEALTQLIEPYVCPRASSMKANPVALTSAELAAVLRRAL
jgi:alcohol dehydrogenase class IV